MSAVVPDEGEVALLEIIKADWNVPLGPRIFLFINDYTPAAADTFASYVLATFPGSEVEHRLNAWGAVATVGGIATMSHPTVTWTRSASGPSQTVYGIVVVDELNEVLYAERNPAGGIPMASIGDSYNYTPIFRLFSQF